LNLSIKSGKASRIKTFTNSSQQDLNSLGSVNALDVLLLFWAFNALF